MITTLDPNIFGRDLSELYFAYKWSVIIMAHFSKETAQCTCYIPLDKS